MIIRQVRAHPFGGLTDRRLDFIPGLNVVLGANEAGKSTLFNAVRTCLFVPTRLTKPTLARLIVPHLPSAGGDFLQVDLELGTAEGASRLSRRRGSLPSAQLVLPGGGTISDDAAIQEQLNRLLPASPATMANVLMIHQWQLMESMDALREKAKESIADLSDLIRRTMLNVGGVSPDRFLADLDRLHTEAFLRWDAARGGPEGNRGIENPWKKDVGVVLRAWYDKETAAAAGKRARDFEAGLDGVNTRLRAVTDALSTRSAFVQAHADAARDARDRRTLEADLGRIVAEAETLRAASREWPVAAHEVEQLRQAAVAAEALRVPLEKEWQEAQRAELGRGLRDRHARVARLAHAVDEAQKALQTIRRVDTAALAEIRAASLQYERAHAQVEAQGISVTVAGRGTSDLVVQEDFAPEKKTALARGQVMELRAGGRIRILHPDMEIEVRGGGSDAAGRGEKASGAKRALDDLCARHGVADPSAAESAARIYEGRAAELLSAERSLATELAGDTLQALADMVTALGPTAETRPVAVLAAEHATLVANAQTRTREMAQKSARLRDWESTYGTQDGLLELLGKAKMTEMDLRTRIGQCAPLPAGFADAAAFLTAFEAAQSECGNLRVELKGLQVRKEDLEKTGPDQSSEELAVQAADADEAFQASIRRGEALGRIAAAARRLLAAGTADLYEGLRARLEEVLGALTGGRHTRVTLAGGLPSAVAGDGGAPLGWEQLSAGTRDSLGLALRLAMAGDFLGNADGFLMMDDPLVEMDPERQQRAAEALRSFAATRQVILFTCHPSTATMLGGNVVTLEG